MKGRLQTVWGWIKAITVLGAMGVLFVAVLAFFIWLDKVRFVL